MRKLNFMILCVITAQMTCGYDEAVVGNMLAMKPWLRGVYSILHLAYESDTNSQ